MDNEIGVESFLRGGTKTYNPKYKPLIPPAVQIVVYIINIIKGNHHIIDVRLKHISPR